MRGTRPALAALAALGLALAPAATLPALLLAPGAALAEAPARAAPPPPRPGASVGGAAGAAMQASLSPAARAGSAAASRAVALNISPPTTAKDASRAAGGPPANPVAVAGLIAEAARVTGRVGFALMDLATGELLETRDGEGAYPPASVAKLFTAAYALETLGPDFRFETRVQAAGAPANGRLAGDLALVGGGDPELDTDALAELAAQLRARGVSTVTGRFLADLSGWPDIPYIDPEQPEDASYNPSVGGLNLDFNRVLFSWKRAGSGYDLAMEARGLRAATPARRVAIGLGSTGAGTFARVDEPGREVWTVLAGALGKDGQRWLPVRRPALHAAEVFRSFAAADGVTLPAAEMGRAPAGGATLALRRSRTLDAIVQDMLKYSTNLTAEAVGLGATALREAPAGDLERSGAAMSRWARARAATGAGLAGAGIAGAGTETSQATVRVASAAPSAPPAAVDAGRDGVPRAPGARRPALSAGIAATMLARGAPAGPARVAGPVSAAGLRLAGGNGGALAGAGLALDLRNHSGLSQLSRVSPVAMTAFLRAADRFGDGRARAGTLRPLIKEFRLDPRKGESKVSPRASAVAKTGTMYFVRGLAGYIDAASGRKLAFAIFSEDLDRRDSLADTGDSGPSRGWLGAAREMERKMVRAWADAY